MKRSFLWVALSALTILCFSACERDEEQTLNVPYITVLEIQGDTLFIKGDFGTETGSVTINNQTVSADDIRSWSETTIVCILDQSLPAEIEVEVITKDKKSNRKKITRTTNTQHYISYLVVDEALGRLFIYGKFDPQRGSVKVNNIPVLEIQTWSPQLIICKIPYNGGGEYGKVEVSSGNKTASRTLYQWTVYFEETRPQSGKTGSLKEIMAAQIYLRGDVGPMPTNVSLAGNSELYPEAYCLYRTGGITGSDYDCGHITATWGDIDMTIEKTAGFTDLSGQTHFQVRKEHLPDGFNIQLDVSFWEIIPATVTTSPCIGNSTTYQYMQSSDLIGVGALTDLPLRFEPGTNNIKTDSITETVSSSAKLIWEAEDSHFYLHNATLKWTCYVDDKPL